MERDGVVRGIWSGTGPGLYPSGPAGRASRHFTTPRRLGVFPPSPSPSFLRQLRRSFAAATPPRPGVPLSTIQRASWPRPFYRCHGTGTSIVNASRPLAAGHAQYKVGVWESLTGNGDFPKAFVFD